MSETATKPGDRFGHPAGLQTLFLTEFWERLSYYGMRAILVLFMTTAPAAGGLGWDAARAAGVYGLYTSGVYLASIPGGWVADRLLGQQRAVLAGGVLIAIGHFCLAVPSLSTFFAGLVVIVLGTGLLKPNISAMVGQLYAEGDPRRDAGFSLFYMGINLGALAAPLVCGTLAQKVGWHWGFGAAGVGMLAGLVQYTYGRRLLGEAGQLRTPPEAPGRSWTILLASLALGGVLIYALFDWLNLIVAVGLVALFTYWLRQGDTAQERRRIAAVIVLFLFSALFWAAFEQAGSSLTLFADRFTELSLWGMKIESSWFQVANPTFIVLFAPVFAWLWIGLGSRNPSSPAKFALGLVFVGFGFLVMALAAMQSGPEGARVSPGWLVACYLFHTWGELSLSPVGLSTVTKLAPLRLAGQMMGVWFLSLSIGNFMGGQVAGLFETLPLPQLFGSVFVTTSVAAVVLVLLIKPIRRLMSGVH